MNAMKKIIQVDNNKRKWNKREIRKTINKRKKK